MQVGLVSQSEGGARHPDAGGVSKPVRGRCKKVRACCICKSNQREKACIVLPQLTLTLFRVSLTHARYKTFFLQRCVISILRAVIMSYNITGSTVWFWSLGCGSPVISLAK